MLVQARKSKNGQRTHSPVVSIIIPVYNQVDFTLRCWRSLRKHTPEHLYELIFIDNASTDPTPRRLAKLKGNVRVIRNPVNQGFVQACNQGGAVARGQYLLFLNNDTELRPGWLEAMLTAMERREDVGAVGAKLVYPDGKLQEAGGLIFSDGSGWNFGKNDDPARALYNDPCEVDYCSGACLLVRSELFRRLKGFDARYAPAYYEDVDLCFSLRKLGYTVRYCPEAEVIHYEGVTAGRKLSEGLKQNQVVNKTKFVKKWRAVLVGQDSSPDQTGRPPVTASRERLNVIKSAKADSRETRRRSVNEVNILVVDPTLPLFDRQAGSLRLLNIIKIFRQQKCNVTYIAREGTAGDKYAKTLKQLGVEVYACDPEKLAQLGRFSTLPPLDLPGILREKFYHYAWLSFHQIAEQYLPDIRRHSPHTKVVIDTVDVHFLREMRQAKIEKSKTLFAQARRTKQQELAIYRQADKLITVTDEDKKILSKNGLPESRIGIIPIIYSVDKHIPVFDQRRDIVFVANFNHLPNIDAVKYFCNDVLPKVVEKIPTIKFNVVGVNPPPELKRLAGKHVVLTGYVPEIKTYLHQCKVSVAPLRFGAGMKGKIVEAMSFGLPVVTTPVGAEGMGLENDKNIIVSRDSQSLANAVINLYTDQALWEKISRNSLVHVQRHFSPEAVGRRLEVIVRAAQKRKAEVRKYYRATQRKSSPGRHFYRDHLSRVEKDLREKNMTLNIISTSHGYRFLGIYYYWRDRLLPIGSRRRRFVRIIFKTSIERLMVFWRGINKTAAQR